MKPRIKMGLLIGVVGLFLNICVAGFIGVCGPIVSIIAGAAAGFFSAQQERLATKADGARAGATSGAIAGGLVIIGQVLAGIGVLVYTQVSGAPTLFGAPPSTSDPASSIGYYIGGLGSGICIGLVGAVLAAGAGAGTGYLGTSEQPTSDNTPISQ